MGRLIVYNMQITLDGFSAGPNDEMDWMTTPVDKQYTDFVRDIGDGIGLNGAHEYPSMAQYWTQAEHDTNESPALRAMAKRLNTQPKYIVSRDVSTTLVWAHSTLLHVAGTTDLGQKIEQLKQQSKKDVFLGGGIQLAALLGELGLVDAYRLVIHPIVLGRGKTIFTTRTPLRLDHSEAYSNGVIVNTYTAKP